MSFDPKTRLIFPDGEPFEPELKPVKTSHPVRTVKLTFLICTDSLDDDIAYLETLMRRTVEDNIEVNKLTSTCDLNYVPPQPRCACTMRESCSFCSV